MPTASNAISVQAASPTTDLQADDKPERVTRKVQDAINAMVWFGLPRAEAAQKAGMTEHGLYKALRRPPVKALYLAECEVLRVSGRARRIHRLEQMVEQDDNKAAVVNAALALERLGENIDGSRASTAMPGLQIVIVQGQIPAIDAQQPTISTTYQQLDGLDT